MKRLASSRLVFLAAALVVVCLDRPAHAQAPEPISIKFYNKTAQPVIIQGASFVGGAVRKGQAIGIPAGKIGWDINVPPGVRQFRIFDAVQPAKVLHTFQVPVKDRNLSFILVPSKGGVEVVPDPTP
jgi:hypothetical protein